MDHQLTTQKRDNPVVHPHQRHLGLDLSGLESTCGSGIGQFQTSQGVERKALGLELNPALLVDLLDQACPEGLRVESGDQERHQSQRDSRDEKEP